MPGTLNSLRSYRHIHIVAHAAMWWPVLPTRTLVFVVLTGSSGEQPTTHPLDMGADGGNQQRQKDDHLVHATKIEIPVQLTTSICNQ